MICQKLAVRTIGRLLQLIRKRFRQHTWHERVEFFLRLDLRRADGVRFGSRQSRYEAMRRCSGVSRSPNPRRTTGPPLRCISRMNSGLELAVRINS